MTIVTFRIFFHAPSQFCIFLTVLFILQLIAGILGFVFADKVMNYEFLLEDPQL